MIDTAKDYWFFLEPYTFLSFSKNKSLLYNSLDGSSIEVSNETIIDLLHKLYEPDSGGVILLQKEQFNDPIIYSFINCVREKYIGDIINISLSTSKPAQLIALYNLQYDVKKNNDFFEIKGNILNYLCEISIYIDHTNSKILEKYFRKFLYQLELIPIHISGDIFNSYHTNLIKLLNNLPSQKTVRCSYTQVDFEKLYLIGGKKFKFEIWIDFPLIEKKWQNVWNTLLKLNYSVTIIFRLTSDTDIQDAENMIDKYQIADFSREPFYTGNNLIFFEENVFLTKEDILSTPLSMREIFANQTLNTFDFGKICIKSNGDIYANINYPPLGNIKVNNIHEILYKELNDGQSWLRIRNQTPCNLSSI
jgi:pseudo-rSAM protein